MHRYIEPLFDLALAAALWFMLPVLVRQFSTPDMYNGMFLTAGFGTLILGTYFLRQVEAEPSWLELVKQPTKRYSGCALLLVTGFGSIYYQAIHACQRLPVSFVMVATGPSDNLSAFLILSLELIYILFPWIYIFTALSTPRKRCSLTSAQGISFRISGMAGVQLGALVLWAGFLGRQEIEFANLITSDRTVFELNWMMVVYIVVMSLTVAILWLPTRLIIKAYNPNRLAWVTYVLTVLIAGYITARL